MASSAQKTVSSGRLSIQAASVGGLFRVHRMATWNRPYAGADRPATDSPPVHAGGLPRSEREGRTRVSLLENCRIWVHYWSMANDFHLIVHFSCPHCATIYAASQEEQSEHCSGNFHCGRCGTPVHEWTGGLYNFSRWKAGTIMPKRIRQRRW